MDLAVKSPLADKFRDKQEKENFVTECDTWIKLGLHPNIVSCHYVRVLGGIPRVFAEYVEQHGLAEIGEIFSQGVKIEVGDMLPSSAYAERLLYRYKNRYVWPLGFAVLALFASAALVERRGNPII